MEEGYEGDLIVPESSRRRKVIENHLKHINRKDGYPEDYGYFISRLSRLSGVSFTTESSKPQAICFACKGTGYVPNPDPGSTMATAICQACGGIGWK